MAVEQEAWQVAAARKREDRAHRLKPFSHWSLGDLTPPTQKNVTLLVHARLTSRERSFLTTDATDLAHRLATRECTAVEVTTAFCKATYAAQELTNCVTEVMFAQALARAHELDEHISKTGQVVGPLHGVPISVKDHIFVEGEDTACGSVAWIGRYVAEEDNTLVHILRQAGAVFYVKTTNPQVLYAFETNNNIYGRTTNPYNRELAAGGSSGGEGALVGARASLLGVGTDLGGSTLVIRIPAAWCGLYGLKPSTNRLPLPTSGLATPNKGKEDLLIVPGPMAHSVRDMELFCRVVADSEPWNIDPNTLNMPWNRSLAQGNESRKLVLGVFADDGVVAPHPPIVEHLQKARAALVAAGHEVIDWTMDDQMEAMQLIGKIGGADGGEDLRASLIEAGEPALPLLERILNSIKPGGYSMTESWATNVERDEFRARALKRWNETALRSKYGRPIDAILCPATATLASPHDTTRWAGYTHYWNLLDLPAAVFPSGKPFNAKEWKSGTRPSLGKPRNSIEEFVAGQWDPDTYEGAPVALQLVGRRWQEEKLLGDLKIVDAVVNHSNA
ncbi:unnamed protein product [Rhizoctonia solani]|uniref:Amidase domain-containing protein n=1 Tax=Rhizoctonia solani TaxID=456999 RepID=A0A8H3GKY4_9AGAM|nr:unnamed protein product [Rhizoctonia solani]